MAKDTRVSATDERDDLGLIFIHSIVDDFGLDPYQFRVYARIARRAQPGGKGAFESIKNMSVGLLMSEGKVKTSLKFLLDHGLLRRESKSGGTSTYTLTPQREWIKPDAEANRSKRGKASTSTAKTRHNPGRNVSTPQDVTCPPTQDVTCPPTQDVTCPQSISIEVNPIEVNPEKEESVKKQKNSSLSETVNLASLGYISQTSTIESPTDTTSDQKQLPVNSNSSAITPVETFPAGRENHSHKIEEYQEKYDSGLNLPKMELLAWAMVRYGEVAKLYRASGKPMSSKANDIDTDFMMFVSERNIDKKKKETPSFLHGHNVIKKMERSPEDWDALTKLVYEWLVSKKTGDRAISIGQKMREATKPQSRAEQIAQARREKQAAIRSN